MAGTVLLIELLTAVLLFPQNCAGAATRPEVPRRPSLMGCTWSDVYLQYNAYEPVECARQFLNDFRGLTASRHRCMLPGDPFTCLIAA